MVSSACRPVKAELTEEEQVENEKSVLDDLAMFGWAKTPIFGSITLFTTELEPLWLNDEICPNGKEANFDIVQRKNSLKLQYLRVAYSYALRGVSYNITSRDFVCQSPNQKPQIFLRLCALGAYRPQSPEERMKERIMYMKDIRESRQKKKEKYSQKPESAGFQQLNM